MLYNVLSNIASKNRDVGMGEISLYSILGYLVVFLGIAFLIFIVWAIGKAFTANKEKQSEVKAEKKQEQKVVATEAQPVEEEISEELVAVITAAIAAYYETAQPQCEFIVKRIKRI